MKVWLIQDYNSMRVDGAFTTKKSAIEQIKADCPNGHFKTVDKNRLYDYYDEHKDVPICILEKLQVMRTKKVR